ncbi:MAG: thioredoxin fold domain-containing protein [Wenzhouxiangella sp.]
MLEGFDASSLISYGSTDAAHEILVFTDTDCGFCRRLHQMIDDYLAAGIAIRYAAFPRAGIGSSTYDDLVSVWCADDATRAMDLAQLGRGIQARQCDAPVQSHYELGRKMGVTGTPFMVTANGEVITGIIQPRELRVHLDQVAANGP